MTADAPATGLDPGLAREILAAVADGFDAQIACTEDLVRCPSLRGQTHLAQDRLEEALAARGYAVDRWTLDSAAIQHHPGYSPREHVDPSAINLVATHRPSATPAGGAGRSLILNGHVDVVPTGPADMWSAPPFAPWRDGDWLYGRGSGDMKAGVVANMFALDALRRLGYQPAARVHLQSVVEEECTGNGTLACLVRGYDAAAALIPEPTHGALVRANVGVIWFRVHVRGAPSHVAEAGKGVNAIEAAHHLIQALQGLATAWNAEAADYPRFADAAPPIAFNVGSIQGGDWPSTVAAWCDFDGRIAIYPGDDPAARARALEAWLHDAAREHPFLAAHPPTVTYTGFFARGYELPEGSDAETTLARAHEAAAGTALGETLLPAYLDARVFALYGNRPCLVYGPVAEHIHGFDERVHLPSVRQVTGAIALFVADWCGLAPLG